MELTHISEKESKDLIYKSNNLINSKYNITLIQARFIAFISSLINAYDDDFFTYSIKIPNILNFLQIDRKNLNWLSESLKQLLASMICLENSENIEEYTTFLSHFKLDKKNGVLEFSFHSSLKPHYLKLKNNFTKLKLEQYNRFESVYTLRFYEWLEYNISLYDTYKNHKYSFKKLKNKIPKMNFIIIKYINNDEEILFNWDLRSKNGDPTVYISRDKEIINMFSIHYHDLWEFADVSHDMKDIK